MYGMPPSETFPRVPLNLPAVESIDPASMMSVEKLVLPMKMRAEWLREQLKMHEAWTLELATLERMIAAYQQEGT